MSSRQHRKWGRGRDDFEVAGKPQAARARLAINLAFGSSLPAMWRPNQNGQALQGTSDGLREVQDAWRRQHWPRTAEGLERIRKARTTHGRRTAEMDRMRAMVRVLMAGAKRLVERR